MQNKHEISPVRVANRHQLHVRAVVLTVSVLGLAPLAMASTAVATNAIATSDPYGRVADDKQATGGPGEAAQASALASNGGAIFSGGAPFPAVGQQAGQGLARAFAAEGALKVLASADASTPGLVQNAITTQASARAQWNDSLVIDAGSGLFLQTGRITATLNVSGTFGGSTPPNGLSSLRIYARMLGTGMAVGDTSAIDPILTASCGGWAYCAGQYSGYSLSFNNGAGGIGTVSGSNIPTTISLDIPVTFGRPTTLGYTLDVGVTSSAVTFLAGLADSAQGSADFSNSLRWGGISGVFDASGAPVLNFATTSTSGFDYLEATPVPAPAAVWLLALGLPIVLMRCRRPA